MKDRRIFKNSAPISEKADHSGLEVSGMNRLRLLERWNRGLQSHSGHGCLCALFCVCVVLCVRSDLATG
jgi:hypothetical protein